MIRHVLIFVITAALGALVALAVRSAFHQPYAAPADDHQHAPTPSQPQAKPAADPHAGHAAPAKPVSP